MKQGLVTCVLLGLTLAIGVLLGFLLRPTSAQDSPSAAELPASKPNTPPIATLNDGRSAPPIVDNTTAKLGADLMARVGRRFVAHSTDGTNVTFYDLPRPFGNSLCRVNSYWIAPKVINGSMPKAGRAYWQDDLEGRKLYAVWTSPSHPDQDQDRAVQACAAYRDFEHTFTSDGADPEHGAELLDVLLKISGGEKSPPFPVECLIITSPHTPVEKLRHCDSRSLLRKWSFKNLFQVMPRSNDDSITEKIHYDTIIMRALPNKTCFSIQFENWTPARYRPIQPSDLRKVTIVLDKSCPC